MTGYLMVRLLRALITLWGIVTVVFLIVRAVPGDPVDTLLGEHATQEERQSLRRTLKLDQSLLTQYGAFSRSVLEGTFGRSFRLPDRTVASLIEEVLTPTLQLTLAALAVGWALGIALGAVAGSQAGTAVDGSARLMALIGLAIPTIWMGPLLILVFSVKLRWLPMPGDREATVLGLILPALTLGSALAAVIMRQTRSEVIRVMREPFVLAAKARGASRAREVFVHALRNALLPVVTVAGAQLAVLLSGTIVTEKIFEREGLGTLFIEAFLMRDMPLIQGCVLVMAFMYVAVNLVIDLLYGVIDPRARLS